MGITVVTIDDSQDPSEIYHCSIDRFTSIRMCIDGIEDQGPSHRFMMQSFLAYTHSSLGLLSGRFSFGIVHRGCYSAVAIDELFVHQEKSVTG
jgi:hypothetical protein